MREALTAQPWSFGSSTRRIQSWQQVIHWLEASPAQFGDNGMLSLRKRWMAWAIFVFAVGFGLINLGFAWWTGMWYAWMWFWASVVVAAFFSLLILAVNWSHSTRARAATAVARLRAAVAAGNDALAPLASVQPLPIAAELTGGSLALRHLHHPEGFFSNLQAFNAGVSLFVGIEQLAFNVIPWNLHSWQSLVLGTGLTIVGLIQTAIFLRLRRPFAVIISERGLEWRQWGRRKSIGWTEVQALCTMYIPRTASVWTGSSPPQSSYWIEGRNGQTLLWTSAPLTPKAQGQATPADDPAWFLCRIVVSEAHQPLRDLTPAVLDIVESASRSTFRLSWRRRPAQTPTQAADQGAGRHNLRAWVRFSIAALLVAALMLSGVVMLIEQPNAYSARLAHADATRPLLSDPLSQPTGLWPVGTTKQGEFSYASGSYRLQTGPDYCCDMHVWAPPIFENATVAVTMQNDTDFNLSRAGLVVRADDAQHTMLVFAVNPSGEWLLVQMHISLDGTEDGLSEDLVYEGAFFGVGAIHKGLHAINRLAVMMRGSSYTFFVNEQFIGSYQGGGLVSGHVGFYSDGLSQGVAFSDFAVYPVPPSSPLFPV